jgi:hypothetical protein
MNDFKDPNKTMQRIFDKHKLNFFGTHRFVGTGNLLSNNERYKINNDEYKINNKRYNEGYQRYNKERSNNRYNNDNRYNPKINIKKID